MGNHGYASFIHEIIRPIANPIQATGWIASKFAEDLLIDPTTRENYDIVHRVVAVASSSSRASAERFVSEFVEPKQRDSCAAYGSYRELVRQDDVDIVYIATPHSYHFQCGMLALTNEKAVLCEKIFTINAAQARLLYDTARSKNLFLMENVWTRFIPLSLAVREHITSGNLGEIIRVQADLSYGETPESWPEGHRMINKDLAGGCLFDLGIYSLTWIFQTLYHTLPDHSKQEPRVKSLMSFHDATGVDETTTVLLEFPSTPTSKTRAHGIATTSFRTDWDPDKLQSAGAPIRIQGSKAELHVYGGPASRPSRIKIIPQLRAATQAGMTAGGPQGALEGEVEVVDFGHPGVRGGGRGMFWAADEVARCWRDGKLESEVMPWEESMVIMRVVDEVRRQGGLNYSEIIESTEYPLVFGNHS